MAIWQALKELKQLTKMNTVLLIHFVAAIQAVANVDAQGKKVFLARVEIKSLPTKGIKVILQWVIPHCRLIRNEKADYLTNMDSHKKTTTK
jgi:ribonuclease HI